MTIAELKIELFKEKDAEELSRMIYLVVDAMERQDPAINYALVREEDKPDELIKASKEGKMWIAKTNDRIVGTLSLMGSRLRRFFVHPDYQRRGIGRMLFENAAAYAKARKIKEITVGAVLGAVPVYKKLGFKEGEIFFNLEINQDEMRMSRTV